MTRRELLGGAVLAGALGGARTAKRTNVVLFMTDDHGAWATGYSGCGHTPFIDGLAKGGTFFRNAFAATPVCSPSRMTWLTGKLPSSHGVQDFLLPEDSHGPSTRRFLDGHLTYTELLAKAGYTLGMCGKWHMGADDRAQAGFSWWATVPGGGGSYRDPEFVRNGKREKLQGFKTDLVTDSALEFLDTVREKPFFLLMPFYAPHTPFDYVPDQYTAPYEGSEFACFPDVRVHPNQHAGLAGHHGSQRSKRAYSGLITGADANIGRVLRKLEEIGQRENTLVIFTADQGWNAGHHGVWGKGNGTWPYNMYEESIRVPLIWNQPGRVPAGRQVEAMVSSYDFFPTILEYLGVAAPGRDRQRVGRSYAALLKDRLPREWRDRLYFEYSYVRSVRTRNLKYVERQSGMHSELYDLEADPGEGRNLLGDASYAERAAGLRSGMRAFFDGIGAPAIDQWKSSTKQRIPPRPKPRG